MTAWTDHVKRMASELGLSYKSATTDARVKASFSKAPRKKATKPQAPSEPPKTAKERRTMAASRAMELIHKRTAEGKQSWHDAASKYIQESADAGSRFMKEKKPRKPMSEETKAMLKERRIRKAVTRPSSPEESTPAERKARRAMAASRAMELTQNKPSDYVPKERKPMSEETKAMLKARREAKKDDLAKKFESFWERHGMGTTPQAVDEAVVDAIAGPSKQRRKPTDEQRARYAETARNKLLNPAAASVFGSRADADRELARQYRNDPKMRKRLTELNKKLGRRITMYQAVMENLLG
jgi:hypothetical protein